MDGSEGRELAVREVARALAVPGDIVSRLPELTAQYRAQRAATDARLARVVETQLRNASRESSELIAGGSRCDVVDASLFDAEVLGAACTNLLPEYDRLKALGAVAENLRLTLELVEGIVSIPREVESIRRTLAEAGGGNGHKDGVDGVAMAEEPASWMEGAPTLERALAAEAAFDALAVLEARRAAALSTAAGGRAPRHPRVSTAGGGEWGDGGGGGAARLRHVGAIQAHFEQVDALGEELHAYLMDCMRRAPMLAREEPAVLVSALRVVEIRERRDRALGKGGGAGLQAEAMERLRAGTRERMKPLLVKAREAGDERSSAAIEEVLADADSMMDAMMESTDYLVPCFPPAYDVFGHVVRAFHERFYEMVAALTAHPESMTGGEILAVTDWVRCYGDIMRGDLKVEARCLEPPLDGALLPAFDAYVAGAYVAQVEWLSNMVKAEPPPRAGQDGIMRTSVPVELFRLLNEQITVVTDTLGKIAVRKGNKELVNNPPTGAEVIVARLASASAKVLSSLQQSWLQQLSPDKLDDTLLESICALVNDCAACYEMTLSFMNEVLGIGPRRASGSVRAPGGPPSNTPQTQLSFNEDDLAFALDDDEGSVGAEELDSDEEALREALGEGAPSPGKGEGFTTPPPARGIDVEGYPTGLLASVQRELKAVADNFLVVARAASEFTAQIVLNDPGVVKLMEELFERNWLAGETTSNLVATLEDYFFDLTRYLGVTTPWTNRVIQCCLDLFVVLYVERLVGRQKLTLGPQGRSASMRIEADEKCLKAFFATALGNRPGMAAGPLSLLGDLLRMAECGDKDDVLVYFSSLLGTHGRGAKRVLVAITEKMLATRPDLPKREIREAMAEVREIAGVVPSGEGPGPDQDKGVLTSGEELGLLSRVRLFPGVSSKGVQGGVPATDMRRHMRTHSREQRVVSGYLDWGTCMAPVHGELSGSQHAPAVPMTDFGSHMFSNAGRGEMYTAVKAKVRRQLLTPIPGGSACPRAGRPAMLDMNDDVPVLTLAEFLK